VPSVGEMAAPATLSAQKILEIATRLGVSRSSVDAQLKMADTEGELDVEPTLSALRALSSILGLAEGGE